MGQNFSTQFKKVFSRGY